MDTMERVHLQEIAILRAIILRRMSQDGLTIKGTMPQEIKEQAKKEGLDPKATLVVYRSLIDEHIKRVFQKAE